MADCPQCGYETAQLIEGYCPQCYADNQHALDLHNAQYDRWQRMTDAERSAEIRKERG